MLNINLKTVSLNGEIIAELIESGEAENIVKQKKRLAERRNQAFHSIFSIQKRDNIERFFHWLPLPAHMTSEKTETLALENGIHVLGSHRFALQSEEKNSYVRVSISSPTTEDELRKGLTILKSIFKNQQIDFFV